MSWTNYGTEENYTVLYCEKGVLSLGLDPSANVIVDCEGKREGFNAGEMATNLKQTNSGIIDLFTKDILANKEPEIGGVEGYQSLDVILTAMEASQQGKMLPVKGWAGAK